MLPLVCELITTTIGRPFVCRHAERIGGGCINRCYKLVGEQDTYFVKLNAPDKLDNLRAERWGLLQLHAAAALRVPQPVAVGHVGDEAALVLEYLPLTPMAGEKEWRQLGAQLAALHNLPVAAINAALMKQATRQRQDASAEVFLPENGFGGQVSSTTLGSRPGFLGECEEWADFFIHHRLKFQFDCVRELRGEEFPAEAKVLQAARRHLSHCPPPSLTHGDLWGGNAGFFHTEAGMMPVVYDPAPFIGDGEVDLAMSELFGGFSTAFYDGYQSVRKIDAGYRYRRDIYNLYHVLNHYNLFGGGCKFVKT